MGITLVGFGSQGTTLPGTPTGLKAGDMVLMMGCTEVLNTPPVLAAEGEWKNVQWGSAANQYGASNGIASHVAGRTWWTIYNGIALPSMQQNNALHSVAWAYRGAAPLAPFVVGLGGASMPTVSGTQRMVDWLAVWNLVMKGGGSLTSLSGTTPAANIQFNAGGNIVADGLITGASNANGLPTGQLVTTGAASETGALGFLIAPADMSAPLPLMRIAPQLRY